MRRLALMAVAAFAVDQASKWFVVWHLGLASRLAIEVWPPFLNLRMAWNRGVNFGLMAQDGQAGRWILIGVALAI
ncbi:MAG TPA: signal peptidase II, partial [Paracoccaceae bacterium]|nr:signal peptidase II [Paracoccaceae bacterium]